MRSAVRAALAAAQQGEGADTSEAARLAARLIDKAAAKGVLKKRAAARKKTRLVKRLRIIALGEEPVLDVPQEEAPADEDAEEEETDEVEEEEEAEADDEQ
jgi:hypothetical protein